jgi:hypothetical protein
MHFRVFRDLEFGLGSWRQREDLLELKPHEKAGLPAPIGITKHPVSDNPKPEPETAPVKRVSMTAEDQALLLASPRLQYSEDDRVMEDQKKVRDRESSKVAAILHQMSQASSSARQEESGSSYEKGSRSTLAKRSMPSSSLESATENAESISPSSAKRVRWSTESLSALGVPLPPRPSTAAQQAATKHFVRMMGRGRVPGSSISRTGRHRDITVLKPIADLKPYDVVLGGALVAHFNLGNRRFIVLASPHLEAFNFAPRRKREEIAALIMRFVREAGGRFLCMKSTSSVFQELSDVQAPQYVNDVLEKLSQLSLDGKDVLRMFHLDCADVWADKKDHKLPDHASPKRDPQILPDDFIPGDFDVICCRRFGAREHLGNLWFTQLIESKSARYVTSKGKMAKGVIVTEVLDTVRNRAGIGGFVKKNVNDENWLEIGDLMAREKISQVRGFVESRCWPSASQGFLTCCPFIWNLSSPRRSVTACIHYILQVQSLSSSAGGIVNLEMTIAMNIVTAFELNIGGKSFYPFESISLCRQRCI